MLRKFLKHGFIIIALHPNECEIASYTCKNGKILLHARRTFELENTKKILSYIQNQLDSHYFSYVAVFYSSIGQGLLPSRNKADLERFGIDSANVSLKRVARHFVYSSTSELKRFETILDILHCDLIYSPFIILQHLIDKSAREGFRYENTTLFILKYSEFICSIIITKGLVKFGSYFKLVFNQISDDDESLQDEKESTNEIMNEFEELDLDDLDSINPNDFLQNEDDGMGPTYEFDMQIFEHIKTITNEFYSNELYDSDFLSDIVIFEHENSCKMMHKNIESEFLIKPRISKIDIFETMLQLAANDIGVKLDL